MKIDKLNLANFRGFEHLEISFEDDVTVIAGVNGVGKSSILQAIAIVSSYLLPKITSSNEKVLEVNNTDIMFKKSSLNINAIYNIDEGNLHVDVLKNQHLSSEEVKRLNEERDKLRFLLIETKKGSKEANDIKDKLNNIKKN